MSDIQAQIKHYSSQAVKLSKQAKEASRLRDFARGKVLLEQAHQASQQCQNLIQQYRQNFEPQKK
ncbi:hypothetical protein [Myxosarcina sp. GI1(2024)]